MCKEFKELKCDIPIIVNAKCYDDKRCQEHSNRLKDKRVFIFKNLETNETFQGIIYDFYKKYNLDPHSVRNVINKIVKATKKWILISS